MAHLTHTANHLLLWGIVGAAGGWGLAVYLTWRTRRARLSAK